jgi:Flp pilus assembly protein TadG
MKLRKTRAEGQSMVEFALLLPLLALILFAIIQYGFILSAYVSVRNASALAARYAILTVPTPTTSQIQALATDAVRPMLDPTRATAVVNTNAVVSGGSGAKSVQVTYNLPLIIGFVVPGRNNDNTFTIRAATIMR